MLHLHTSSFNRKMSNNQESVTMSNTEKHDKIKKELEKVGMYQSNFTLDYMEKIYDAIQESKEMANIPINNAGNQKDLLHPINNLTNKSDITIKGDSISEIDNNRAKPSCSYNTHCNNSSSDSPKPRNKRNIANKKKCTDDNDGSDNGADKNLSHQKSKNNSLQECCNLRGDKKISSLQKDFQYQSKRWKINPLDSQSNQKDVALQQSKRPPVQERLPFRLCKGTHTEEESVKILNDLNIHLKNMANLWLNCYGTTELKFQWGTPIQVDTDNNSLGRIPSMVDCYYDEDDIDMISNYDEGENVINNCNDEDNLTSNYDRVSKRKASWFANAKISNSSSDDETTLSFIKKPKSDDTSKMYKTLHKKELSNQEKDCSKEDLDKEDLFSNNNLINEKDDTNNKSKPLQGPNERTVSPKILSNPRRDTVSKSSLLDINKTKVSSLTLRNNKKGSNQCDLEGSPSTSRKESLSSIQTNKELIGQLDKIDKNINEALITKDAVVKLLPMKNFSTRLAKQCAKLKQTDAERKKKILLDETEAVRKTIEEKDKKKQEYVKRRMQELEEMSKEKLKVINKEKKKNRLMEVLEAKSTSRTPKWRDQRKKLIKKQKKDSEIDEDEIDKIIEEIENDDYIYKTQVTCPICNKSFASDKIENHAAVCDQFQTEDEFKQDYVNSAQNSKSIVKEKVKNSQALYECNICSSFQTDSGIDYEDHVNECLQNRQNSPPRGTPILIDVPDSPINSYQSISEQRNSNIDYTDQLTNITKKAQIGRKRRR